MEHDGEQAPAERPYSVQLHVHGSFSEGMGSIDSHSYEASQLGVDAIWWSDHDFRISSYQHVDHFGFEGPAEPIDAGESWHVQLKRHSLDEKTISSASGAPLEFVEQPVRAGQRALRLELRGRGPEFGVQACILAASRKIHRRPLAGGVRMGLAVYPEQLSEDARPYVRILLSEHAPRGDVGLESYSLRYFLTEEAGEPYREGATFHIPVCASAGRWNDLQLDLSADALRGFPEFPGRDNALYRIVVGVEARNNSHAAAVFDELQLEHRQRGNAMFAVQRDVIKEVARNYPALVQFQGVEISYASRHLNEFSLHPELIDYDALAQGVPMDGDSGFRQEAKFRRAVTRRAVRGAHQRGGLVSYNHLFGVGMEHSPRGRSREQVLEMMQRNRSFGVDILEVGYRDRAGADLADHLWVWDQLALAGQRLVGTGVSDSHGGPLERWSGRANNFVSWIYAPELSQAALLEGLRHGRVFFGDIERFDGALDMRTSAGDAMGRIVVSTDEKCSLVLRVEGAAAGDQLRVLFDGAESLRMDLKQGSQELKYSHNLPASGSSFVRLELLDAAGEAKALGNPIYFVQPGQVSAGLPLPGARTCLRVLGLGASTIEGLSVAAVECLPAGGVALDLEALPGPGARRLELELGDFGTPAGVRFESGLTGNWRVQDGALRIECEGSAGRVVILPDSGA